MEHSFRFRLYLLTALVLVGFGALLSRLHEFQIERRDEFLQKVPGNRTVTVREPGIRGEITDRNGITLARNRRNYEVSFDLDEIRNAYVAQRREEPKIERLTQERGMPRKRSERDIVTIVQESTLSVLADPDLDLFKPYNSNALRVHYLTHGGLIPFSYRSDLSYEEFAKFAEHNLDLPGVYLSIRPQRQYPYGALASHVLGYLKQWEKGDVSESATRKFNHYIGDAKGIAGVEASMDDTLRGLEGQKSIVKDEKGRTIRMSDYIKPGVGAKLQLTIDAPVQYLLENTLRLAGRAAGVVMDVNTGEVLAMASVPDYNPNDFIPSINQDRWDSYRSNAQLAPFTNRAISSFEPGSTMKVPTAIAGLLEGTGNRTFSCDGFVSYGGRPIGCWIWNMKKGRHGSQDLAKAIQQSCNPYFNKLANTIRNEAMVEGCQMVGIGRATGIELPKEDPGILPGSRAWRANNPNTPMTQSLNAFLSIGQGDTLASPLQMCAIAATVGNGGKYYRPRIVKNAVAENGQKVIGDIPRLEVDLIQAGIKPAELELVRKGMWMSVNQAGGTSGRVRHPDIEIAAKSGTAQTVDNGKPSNNSWIMSFAPYENPKYAVCIMVQNASSGGGVCGPLVNLIYRGLFARDNEGVRLPLRPQPVEKGSLGSLNARWLKELGQPEQNLLKILEIPADIIAAVEAGDPNPSPEAIAAVEIPEMTEEPDAGETGEEVGQILASPAPESDIEPPTPTITPEVDAEGSVIPRAVPVPEP
ncbi:MAG: penicillin-binding transpeptidase domain-containing protein [Akkermansiaceae bacterium]